MKEVNAMDALRLFILSPEGPLLDESTSSVAMKAADGWFGIRKGMAATAAALLECDILYTKEGKTETFHIAGGFAVVKNDTVTILAAPPAL